MPDCIFCKIVQGLIPSTKLFEDEHSICIFDVNPIAKAHSLFITREHYPTLLDVPEDKLSYIVGNLQRVIPAILKATNSKGFNVIQNNHRCAGQVIPHLHFHIIPRREDDEVHFGWHIQPYQKEEMTKLAETIRQIIS
jgi:histidine triad (HIT) family protein